MSQETKGPEGPARALTYDEAAAAVRLALFDVAAAARRFVRATLSNPPGDRYGADGPKEQLVAAVDAYDTALFELGRAATEAASCARPVRPINAAQRRRREPVRGPEATTARTGSAVGVTSRATSRYPRPRPCRPCRRRPAPRVLLVRRHREGRQECSPPFAQASRGPRRRSSGSASWP
jgi:hypothetical protein